MQGSIWLMLFYIALAGALGGIVNAFMSENGFLLPKSEQTSSGSTVMRPGYLGNIFIGSTAATVSWGLYGPLASFLIVGTPQAIATNTSLDKVGLSLASLVGAMLVGIGGAKWLSTEVDKNLLRAAATEAAGKQSSSDASKQMALANPAEALSIARTMK